MQRCILAPSYQELCGLEGDCKTVNISKCCNSLHRPSVKASQGSLKQIVSENSERTLKKQLNNVKYILQLWLQEYYPVFQEFVPRIWPKSQALSPKYVPGIKSPVLSLKY